MLKPLTVWITTNWKFLQEMGIPDHSTCLLKNLYAAQEARIRTGHGTMDWFQTDKGVRQGTSQEEGLGGRASDSGLFSFTSISAPGRV